MRKYNKRVLGVLALLLTFGQLPGVQPSVVQAATAPSIQSGKPALPQPPAPTVIEADQVYFSSQSGDMFARGNVKITQNQDTILTDYMRGNQQKTTIWVDGSATLLQPDTKLTGNGLTYNYTAKTGTVNQASGVLTSQKQPAANAIPGSVELKQEYLTGQKVELSPGYLVALDATYTGCDLKDPDYHISADKVELWPGDKLIAYNAKFWIKDTVIFALPRYEHSLTGVGDQGGAFPSVGYANKDGVFIRQKLSYPLNPNLQVYTNLVYYTQAGFKPQYGVKWDKSKYYLQVETGDYRDSESVWITKKPEFQFGIPNQRIGSLPVSYRFTASYGKWTEADKTSWHQDYSIYFTGDPIALDVAKTLHLSLGTGFQHIRESYDNSINNVWRFDTTLSKQWSPKLNTFVAHHYKDNYDSIFTYDKTDVSNELAPGVSYAVNSRNTLSYKQSYDLDNSKLFSQTYGWNYNMHCWLLDVNHTNYTDGRDARWRVKFDTNF